MQEFKKMEDISENIKQYVNTNLEIVKLELTNRTAIIGSELISSIVIGLISFMFLFIFSIGLGFYFSELLNNNFYGFSIVAGFYLVLLLCIVLFRKKLIQTPLRDKIIRKFLNND